jgi:hypothetical protein
MSQRTTIAGLALGGLLTSAMLSEANATLHTINQTVDLRTVSLAFGEIDSAISPFAAFTPEVGDEIDYNVTFTHGAVEAGSGGPHDLYQIFGFLDGPGAITQARCDTGTSSMTLGGTTHTTTITACGGFLFDSVFSSPGTIDGFSARIVISNVDVLDPSATDNSFDGASFEFFPTFDDATPLAIVLDPDPVPEPASAGLFAAALVTTGAWRLRRRVRA